MQNRLSEKEEPKTLWLRNEQGVLAEYEVVVPTSGSHWSGRYGRRPRPTFKGDERGNATARQPGTIPALLFAVTRALD